MSNALLPVVDRPAAVDASFPPTPSSAPTSRWRWLRRFRWTALVALGLIAGGLYLGGPLEAFGLIVVLFLLIVPFEKFFPRHSQRIRRKGLGTDMAYAMATPVLAPIGIAVAIVVGFASLAWIPGLLLRPLVGLVPGFPRMLLGLALFDLAIYWVHRWSHEIPFLWRFHSVHHSSEKMDWISGLRNHPVDGAIVAPPFILLLAAGFSAEFSGALAVIQFVTGLFLHANVRWRWRRLWPVVITPEFHHWHHSNELAARNTNYSVFLPVWDMLFGTYRMPADQRPQVYGVDEPIPPTLAGQLHYPLRGLPGPRAVARHPWRATGQLLRAVRRGVGQVRRATYRRHPVPIPF